MKRAHSALFTALRLLTLAAACVTTSVRADDYGAVSQLLLAGKLAEAMSKADAYLATKPGDPQMRFLKGVIQRNAGKPSEAIATFIKLTEDYPELPEPYNNLAVLYASQSQFDKSRVALEMAIRTNPSYATAHENLGDVYTRLASEAYNKALQLDASNAAVPPKLALIRELFKPNLKSPNSAPSAATTAATPPVAASATAVAAQNAARSASATPPATTRVTPPAPPVAAAGAATVTSPSTVPAKAPAGDSAAASEAEAAVRAWAKAWSSKNLSAYLGAYGKDFTPSGKQSRKAWEDERRSRIAGKSSISVKLENLSVKINGSTAVVKFRQDYRADALAVSSRKTLELLKSGERWLIVRESTGN